MNKYPYEGARRSGRDAAIIIPLGMWLRHGAEVWSFGTLAIVCISIFKVCLLIGLLVDKRDADRRRNSSNRLGLYLICRRLTSKVRHRPSRNRPAQRAA